MTRLTVRAPAKVNLFLRVLARETSGYHQIETLFQALELHDTVEVERLPEPGVKLEVTWEGAFAEEEGQPDDLGPVEENLAYRAAAEYRRRGGLEDAPGVAIHLTKRIPAGAGLGGGSSDAAAVLRAMNRLHGGALEEFALLDLAGGLGSDVPFFLGLGPLALGWGRGERLLVLPRLEPRPVLVVVPPFRVSTADAYRRLAESREAETEAGRMRAVRGSASASGHPSPGTPPLTLDELSSWSGVADRAVNDFEAVVLGRGEASRDGDPAQGRRILELLRAGGAAPALLSGSGSALFGVFPGEADAGRTADEIRSAVPASRVVRTASLEGWHRIVTG